MGPKSQDGTNNCGATMTKKEQTPNRIIVKKKRTSKDIPIIATYKEDMYTNMFTLRMTPISRDYMLKIAEEWISCVLNEDMNMLTMEDFLVLKGLQRKTLMRWCEKCPELKEAHDWVAMVLGNRRHRGMMLKTLDTNSTMKCQYLYDENFRQAEEWRANLQAKVAGAGNTVTIVEMEKFADADLLETKKED